MTLTSQQQTMIEAIAKETLQLVGDTMDYVSSPPEYGSRAEPPDPEGLRGTAFWKDLATIVQYTEGQPSALPDVKRAIHQVTRQVVGLVGRLLFGEPELPPDLYTGDSVTFILIMARYRIPSDFQETALGQLLHRAYSFMVGVADVLKPTEVMKVLGSSRQRVYDLTREGRLTPIYKPTGPTRQARAMYFARQVEEIKAELSARPAPAKRPPPPRKRSTSKSASTGKRRKAEAVLGIH